MDPATLTRDDAFDMAGMLLATERAVDPNEWCDELKAAAGFASFECLE